MQRWEELAQDNVSWAAVIQPGLEKLSDYSMDLDEVPAYTLAMGNLLSSYFPTYEMWHSYHLIALDPRFKLNPYQDDVWKYQKAKQMLIDAVGSLDKFFN